ncbi:M20 metallopeptidase family protein [Fusobacterium sp. PH5-44]|uniref:M20 metallopeptidase family protein n=1 Tax=unclassified Fusobacterium TaxID=2648384 RepID=UPI003D2028A3
MNKLLKQFRKDLHQIPEVAFEELETSKYIRKQLEIHDISYEIVANTGTLVFFSGIETESIAFRADIDALPIVEETGISYASTNGNMHACGHDGHTSILLAFSLWLKEQIKNGLILQKSILLIFQPAEEGKGGARYIANDKKFLDKQVSKIFGLHLYSDIEQGHISTKPGPIMAQTINLDITIHGKGAHGAQPQNGIDTILITAKLIEAYQSIISRNIPASETVVLTIGSIHGGVLRNIIPKSVDLLGTIRLFNKELIPFIKTRIDEINKGFEISYGIKINLNFTPIYSPVFNNKNLYETFREITKNQPFIEAIPQMAAEDFSFYLEKVPGLFFLLGTKNIEKNFIYPLHNPKFNFDEDVLKVGLNIFQDIFKYYNK